MRQHSAVVLAVLLVTSMVAVPVAGLAATDETGPAQTDDGTDENKTTDETANASVAPGERFAGVVGVQEAEIEGEVDERAFGIEVAKAGTNDSQKANAVTAQLGDIEQRLDRLEQRKQELNENRENMSEGRYRAEMSQVAARLETTKRLANQSETVSRSLPLDVLESKEINVTAIRTLQERASGLSGPDIAEIAREIAGPSVGGPPDDRGPDERPGRGPDRGPDQQP